MASRKWTINSATLEGLQAGTTHSNKTVELTISPQQGFVIDAKNFMIGNGQLQSVENGIYTWVAKGGVVWNADERVEKVELSNNRPLDENTPATPDNEVIAKVYLKDFTLTYSGTKRGEAQAQNLFIDFDESTDYPIPSIENCIENPVCLFTQFPHSDNQTVTQTGVVNASIFTNIVSSNVQVGSSTQDTINKLKGTVAVVGRNQLIGKITFEAAAGYYYNIRGNGRGSFAQWMRNDVDGKSIVISVRPEIEFRDRLPYKITFNIFWENKDILRMINEYGDDLADYLEDLRITAAFNLRMSSIPQAVTNTISKVGFPSEIRSDGGTAPISVYGIAGTNYNMRLFKTTSTSSIVPAATNAYYNFKTKKFQTQETFFTGSVRDSGSRIHRIEFPAASTKTNYHIVLDGNVANANGEFTKLADGVPQAPGDAVITQLGNNTITVKPITFNPSNFGTLPANITITRSEKSGSQARTLQKRVTAVGGTSGASSTKLVLSRQTDTSTIVPGMFIIGDGITQGATVSYVKGREAIMSVASTVANGTNLTFISNTGELREFSFTILPNSNTLNVNSSAVATKNIGGLREVKVQSNANLSKSTTLTVTSTKGIVPGMTVSGTNISKAVTVSSVTSATVLELSEAQSFKTGENLIFSGSNAAVKSNVERASVTKVGSNIVINGYLNLEKIAESGEVRVYIDDLITVS